MLDIYVEMPQRHVDVPKTCSEARSGIEMKSRVDTEEKRYKGYALKHSFLGVLTAFTLKLSSHFYSNHISSDITSI